MHLRMLIAAIFVIGLAKGFDDYKKPTGGGGDYKNKDYKLEKQNEYDQNNDDEEDYDSSSIDDSGRLGPWSSWSKCSSTCSGGTTRRSRKCIPNDKRYKGKVICEGKRSEKKGCNKNISCHEEKKKIVGVWSLWGHWSAVGNHPVCDDNGAKGKFKRVRKCRLPGAANIDSDLTYGKANEITELDDYSNKPIGDYKKPNVDYKKPDVDYKKPDGEYKKPEGDYKKPEGEYKKSDGEYKKPDGEYKKIDGEYKKPDGEYKKPEDEYKKPDGEYKKLNGEYKKPDEEYKKPGGEYKKPDGEYKRPDGEYKKPEGEYKKSDGEYKKPEDKYNKQDGEYKQLNGEYKKPEGKYIKPEGEYKKDIEYIKPSDYKLVHKRGIQEDYELPKNKYGIDGEKSRNHGSDIKGIGSEDGTAFCSGEFVEYKELPIRKCPYWTEWTQWSACNQSDNIQVKWRTCLPKPVIPGFCQGPYGNQRKCPSTWDNWCEWSKPDKTCGKCSQQRSRKCKEGICEGDTNDVKYIDLDPCATWGDWCEWSKPDKTCGKCSQLRDRKCKDGKCEGENKDTKYIELAPCPTWGDWCEWSKPDKTCGKCSLLRDRKCKDGNCEGEYKDTKYIELQPCPTWDEWCEWSKPDKTCGKCSQIRDRKCKDGKCEGEFKDTKYIELPPCPTWEDWCEWSKPDKTCGKCSQIRDRKCKNGDGKCEGEIKDTKYIELPACPPEDAEIWDEWCQWSKPDKTCGKCAQVRERKCKKADGKCVGDYQDTKFTELPPCKLDAIKSEPVKPASNSFAEQDDNQAHENMPADHMLPEDSPHWSHWTAWTKPKRTCGSGKEIVKRTRTCQSPSNDDTDYDYEPCTGKASQKKTISLPACSDEVAGSWSEWSNWSSPSKTCGIGSITVTRTRKCSYGDCAGTSIDSKVIPLKPCQVKKGGSWSNWSEWSNCKTNGQKFRTRKCLPEGETCEGETYEFQKCNPGFGEVNTSEEENYNEDDK